MRSLGLNKPIRASSLFANGKNEQCGADHFTERSQTAKSADPWTLNSLARRPPAAPPTCSLRLGDRAARLASLLVATVFERFGGSRPGAFGNTSHPVRRASVTDWSSTVHRRLLAVFALWPTLDEAPMRKLFCATAPVVLLCALPVNAQQQLPAGPVALAVAPSHEQLGLEGDLGIEPAAPTQPQIAPQTIAFSGSCRTT